MSSSGPSRAASSRHGRVSRLLSPVRRDDAATPCALIGETGAFEDVVHQAVFSTCYQSFLAFVASAIRFLSEAERVSACVFARLFRSSHVSCLPALVGPSTG